MNQNAITILMIEDLKIAQLAAAKLFSQIACKLQAVSNAASALENILRNRYDMIFIDIQLPDMDGYELAQTIRSIERPSHHLPLIAITADYTEELQTRSKLSGFDDFVLKPLTIETIRYTLAKHLDKSKHYSLLYSA